MLWLCSWKRTRTRQASMISPRFDYTALQLDEENYEEYQSAIYSLQLHLAVSNDTDLKVVELLLKKFPDAADTTDKYHQEK
mmetsp:Transcript_21148/g.31001  ORF Transcript_21148/g.31001 Transcript_21148/m.31001 type:complete len:81 (+) Transcript_21148:208-450(+)